MLSAVARSAVRRLNTPAQQVATQSRSAFNLPLILSGQRYYSAAASEAAEHPDPSSTATTTTPRSPASPRAVKTDNTAAKAFKDNKAKDLVKAKKEEERLKAAAKKDNEKLKAAAEKEKKKLKAAAEKEKEKLKAAAEKEKIVAKKAAEKAKAQQEREKIKAQEREKIKAQKNKDKERELKSQAKEQVKTLAERAEIATAISNILVLPKSPNSAAWSLYVGDKMREKDAGMDAKSYMKVLSEKWSKEDAVIKEEYLQRGRAMRASENAAQSEFILSHTPLEIYNHNRSVHLLKKSGIAKSSLIRGSFQLPSEAKLTEIKDERIPKVAPPHARALYMAENFHKVDGSATERFTQLNRDFKALSENEVKDWKAKAEAHRTEVWAPAMMKAFGTTQPSKIPLENKSAPSTAA